MSLHGSNEVLFTDTAGPQTRRRRYNLLRQQLDNERSSFISHWRELGNFIAPRRTRFFQQDANRGDRRTKDIIDSTATFAARNLSAGMMGGVTSPARPWFRLSVPDKDLAELDPVKLWLSIVTQRMIAVFLKSNLYQSLPILYKDGSTFGTGCVFLEEDFDTVFRSYSMPLGSYMLGNDDKLRVRVFAREFRMTIRQLIEKFGNPKPNGEPENWDVFSQKVRSQWDSGHPETWIEVCHIIAPNELHDPEKPESKFKKYASLYFERGDQDNTQDFEDFDDRFLRESGFDVFPVLAFRWEVTGEDVYGTDCPGMTALGDIKELQLGRKRMMQAIDKMVKPPMKGPAALRTQKVSILPGDITYLDERDGQKGFTPVHEVDPRIRELDEMQEQTRGRIRKAYYEDLFLQLSQTDRREITAREVEERHEEKLLALGSVLERLNEDVLDPLIDITFDLMLRQDLIPEAPPELAGEDLKAEYVSIMAQAQKLAGLAGIERTAQFVLQLASGVPGNEAVLDKIDMDQMIDEYGEIVGVSPRIIVSDEAVAEIRAARAEAEQAAQAAAQAQQVAAATKDMAKADLEKDSVLSRLIQATESGAGGGEVSAAEGV